MGVSRPQGRVRSYRYIQHRRSTALVGQQFHPFAQIQSFALCCSEVDWNVKFCFRRLFLRAVVGSLVRCPTPILRDPWDGFASISHCMRSTCFIHRISCVRLAFFWRTCSVDVWVRCSCPSRFLFVQVHLSFSPFPGCPAMYLPAACAALVTRSNAFIFPRVRIRA